MPLSIGVNLRVTGHCNQGGRKYMEDMFSVAFQPTADDKDLEYAFFGIFDGHGGGEAATFAKEHLMDIIVKQKNFWSDRDEDVLRAIKDGYVNTHYAMWRELDKWPRTASGLPSTAGTTATIAFIRKGKIYIGHVGDSCVALGYQVDEEPQWKAKALTKDHKPESGPEMMRIQQSGGKVVSKSGVPRVVWNRPRIGHKGPVRRSTQIDEIPFLAVARSLGDLWSYNSELDRFVVSPEPDVKVVSIDVKSHKCLIFGTDGLWNMLTPHAAVTIVQAADRHNEKQFIASQQACNGQADEQMWVNPSKSLVDRALERWSTTRLRADNTSAVTLMLDPPGPSRSEVLLNQKEGIMMSNRLLTPSPLVIGMPMEVDIKPSIPPPTILPRPPSPGVENFPILVNPPEDPKVLGTFRYEDDACVPPRSSSIAPRLSLEDGKDYPSLHSVLMPMEDVLPSQSTEEHINLPIPIEAPLEHYHTPIETSPVASTSAERMERPAEAPQTFLVIPEDSDDSFSDAPEKELEGDNARRSSPPIFVPIEEILDPYLYYARMEERKRPATAVDLASPEKPDSSDEITPAQVHQDAPVCEASEELRESIQVAEISSSVLPPVPAPAESKEAGEVISLEKTVRTTKKQRMGNAKETYESERVRLCVRKLPQSSPEKIEQDSNAFDAPPNSESIARSSILKSSEVPRSSGTPEKEQQESDTSETVRKPSSLFASLTNEFTIIRRRRVTHQKSTAGSPESLNKVVSVNPRLKLRTTKVPAGGSTSEEDTSKTKTSSSNNGGAKRKHSAISPPVDNPLATNSCTTLEPCSKRRTRSEDGPNPTDENDPANQATEEPKSRLGWVSSDSLGTRAAGNSSNVQDRRPSPSNFQRRSLGKKASPVKAIRRPSLNGTSRIQQLRGSFGLRDWDQSRNGQSRHSSERRLSGTVIGPPRETSGSQRWLRSDTMAATPVKTLRSRNVDINGQTIPSPLIHQYGVVKQNRLSIGGNLKQSSGSNALQTVGTRIRSSSMSPGKFKQANASTTAGLTCASISPASASCATNANCPIVKRVKSPYNPGSRTLSTRSRMKILPYGK